MTLNASSNVQQNGMKRKTKKHTLARPKVNSLYLIVRVVQIYSYPLLLLPEFMKSSLRKWMEHT